MEKTVVQKLIGLLAGLFVIGAGIFLILRPKTSLTDLVVLIAAVLLIIAFIDIAAVAAFPSDITKAFEYFALFNVGS